MLLHYRLLSKVDSGGMGEIYKAEDTKLNRTVAIKLLLANVNQEPIARRRFLQEAQSASALSHPNIVTIHSIEEADGLDFIVMEYVRGEPLSQVLARGPLSVQRALEYGVQIADALVAAHGSSIVHRDLKPGNIMITPSGLVKVLDFGIAKRFAVAGAGQEETTAALTVAGMTTGTPAYMSPEQALGDPVDGRSDLFSLGIVLYEMLTGARPFRSDTNLGLVRQIVYERHVSLPAAVPPDIAAIVDRCLQKHPADRYSSATDVRDALRRLAARFGPESVPSTDEATRASALVVTRPLRDRLSRRAVLFAIAGVLLVSLLGWSSTSVLRVLNKPSAAGDGVDANATPQELVDRAGEELRLSYVEGNVDRAVERLTRAIQLKSPYPIAEARLSLAYWRKNSLRPDPEWQKRAKAHAERAVAADEQLALAHVALGAAAALAGDVDAATAAYGRAEALEPANWELLWRQGDLANTRKDLPGAEKFYRRAAESGAKEWEAHARLGNFLYQRGRYQEAVECFERMRDLAPNHTRAYSNLAAAYHQLGRTDESAAVLQRAIAIAPDALAYSNLGTYLYFQGKYNEAVAAFQRAVDINANAYQRWGNLGDAVRMVEPGSARMHESYRRALQLAQEELAKRPDDLNIRSSVALFLIRDGQREPALAELDRVMSAGAQIPAVLFKAALVAELAGERARALGLLGQALDAGYRLREISAEPDLVNLRADPGYHRLVARREK